MDAHLTDIDDGVRAVLARRLRLDWATTAGGDDSLLDLGLDSTAILGLVVGIEEQFGIEIPDRDITLENLGSIGAIAQYVARRVVR